jgi:hypothetical protein
METSRDLFKMVEGDSVLEEGSRVLAFIDTMEEHGYPWMLAKMQDGSYKAAVFAAGRLALEGRGATPGAAIKELSRVLVEEGRKGLPRC